MILIAVLMAVAVAFEHFGFLVLEMFLWQTPIGLHIFHQTVQQAAASAVLAANQGLYNGFLAAGLLWALFAVQPTYEAQGNSLKFFFSCVVVAGVFGGITVGPGLFLVQALPGLVGLIAVHRGFGTLSFGKKAA